MNPQGSVGYTTLMRYSPIKLLHFSDTHVREKDELHPIVKEALKEADWVVHTGDFTGPTLVHQLIEDHPKFVGVFGNTDKDETRRILPTSSSSPSGSGGSESFIPGGAWNPTG